METTSHQARVTELPSDRTASVIEEFEQPRYSRRDTLPTMFGVLMVMLLGSLDQTIVATALPHVIADLHGFNQYTWVSHENVKSSVKNGKCLPIRPQRSL